MKPAGIISLVLVVVCVGFAASSSEEEFLRWETAMVDFVCKNSDHDALVEEITECEKTYPADVNEKYLKCYEETDIMKYLHEGCTDDNAVQMYYACMKPSFGDEDFREKKLNSKGTLDCILNAVRKHGVESEELVLKDQ